MLTPRLRPSLCSTWEGSGGVEGGWETAWAAQGSSGGSLMLSPDTSEAKLGSWSILGKEGGKSMEATAKEEDGHESRSNLPVGDPPTLHPLQA